MKFSKLKLTAPIDWKAATTVFVALCMLLALGFWQLERAGEKRRKQKTIETRLTADPIAIEEIRRIFPESLDFRHVFLQGSYLSEKSILLVDRFYLGRQGYEVLTPVKLVSTDQIVVVSRGWTALEPGAGRPSTPGTPQGIVRLNGTIHVTGSRSFFVDRPLRDEQWPMHLRHLNLEKIDKRFALPVFPYVVRLDEAMPGVLSRYWTIPDTNPERSTSYALQWFAMALLLFLVALIKSTNIAEIFRSKAGK